ncbi:MAG: ParB/RepB/Spo0J family partition protein [Candidatus Aminicenantes bacterium]|nr:ParB/RepB/Spo0J family partition protein [Candidatus Aminicenantes bacterium]
MKRKVLGRGIEAIISNKPAYEQQNGLIEIDIDNIYPNPNQPRKKFSVDKIKGLANSIKESGLIQPVVVYKEDEKYYLLVGERRWRASQYLKWKKIPAIVQKSSVEDSIIKALIENIQREDLNAVEIAEGIEVMMKQTGLNQDMSSEKLGMNRSTLTNYLRLLKLPEAVKQSIISGNISQGHARVILALEDNNDKLIALSHILQNRLSVRQTETYIKEFDKQKKAAKIIDDPDVIKTEEKLTRFFSTKVKLKYSKSGSGRIEIFFSALDEFERIYKLLYKDKE